MKAKKHFTDIFYGTRLFVCGVCMLAADVVMLVWSGIVIAFVSLFMPKAWKEDGENGKKEDAGQ